MPTFRKKRNGVALATTAVVVLAVAGVGVALALPPADEAVLPSPVKSIGGEMIHDEPFDESRAQAFAEAANGDEGQPTAQPFVESAPIIDAGRYTITLPLYWKDRVRIDDRDEGTFHVYANSFSEAPILRAHIVDPNAAASVGGSLLHERVFAGDIDAAQRVEVWDFDCIFLVGAGLAFDGSGDFAALNDPVIIHDLVDLQTLGQVSGHDLLADKQAGLGEYAIMRKYDFANEASTDAIVAAIVVK